MQRLDLAGAETTKRHLGAAGRALLVDVIILVVGCATGVVGLLLADSGTAIGPASARIFFPAEVLFDHWQGGSSLVTFLLALCHYPGLAMVGVLLRTSRTRIRYLGIVALIHGALFVVAMALELVGG